MLTSHDPRNAAPGPGAERPISHRPLSFLFPLLLHVRPTMAFPIPSPPLPSPSRKTPFLTLPCPSEDLMPFETLDHQILTPPWLPNQGHTNRTAGRFGALGASDMQKRSLGSKGGPGWHGSAAMAKKPPRIAGRGHHGSARSCMMCIQLQIGPGAKYKSKFFCITI